MRVNITNVYANPSSNTILPTAPENIKFQELPAAESIILVPSVQNVPLLPRTVHMAVPDTTPAAVVLPASLIPTAMFPPSPVPMAVRLITAVRSVLLVMVILTVT